MRLGRYTRIVAAADDGGPARPYADDDSVLGDAAVVAAGRTLSAGPAAESAAVAAGNDRQRAAVPSSKTSPLGRDRLKYNAAYY